MNKIIIYYHIFAINNWYDIVFEQMTILKKTKLLENSIIRVGILYNDINEGKKTINFLEKFDNVEIMFSKNNSTFGESETLSMLKDFSMICEKNFNILYIHTKGVTHYNTIREKPVKEWRNMMEYFLIENWKKCIKKLNDNYDCCGINYQNHNGNINGEFKLIKIFNGNFYWCKTDYIKKLDKKLLFEHKYSCENWLTTSNPKVYSFYNTPNTIDLYYQINENYK